MSQAGFRLKKFQPLSGVQSVVATVVVVGLSAWMAYTMFLIDVPTRCMAILTKKVGKDLPNDMEIAPTEEYKGVQKDFLLEGRTWRNPYVWSWKIIPQEEIPHGKLGVLVSLTGENLGYGQFVAQVDEKAELLRGGVISKGIVPTVLREGRYPIHPYLFKLELHDPVVVPPGYRGVVTNLAGPIPDDPNTLLVENDLRGVQTKTLDEGTYYLNPYLNRVSLVDCRSQRFNLSENQDMGFPSKDGFWVSLDGIVEFRVEPERASEVFVTYNDESNDSASTQAIDEEIIRKVIMPIARSFCRVEGSKKSGRDFISGETRLEFQRAFEAAMRTECEPLGIDVLQALITNIRPPQQIAQPVRDRELAKQKEKQYQQQILQQKSEEKLAMEQQLVKRKQELIKAEQEVVKTVTQAEREQEVAITKANEGLEVAKLRLKASKDEAEAIVERGKAEAQVVEFNNKAEAAGWKKSVEAFSGDGGEFARYTMYQKLAGAYQKMMINTANSPIMDIFKQFEVSGNPPPQSQQTEASGEASDETAAE